MCVCVPCSDALLQLREVELELKNQETLQAQATQDMTAFALDMGQLVRVPLSHLH